MGSSRTRGALESNLARRVAARVHVRMPIPASVKSVPAMPAAEYAWAVDERDVRHGNVRGSGQIADCRSNSIHTITCWQVRNPRAEYSPMAVSRYVVVIRA